MNDDAASLAALRDINALAAFNRWAGITVESAGDDGVEILLPWRDEFGQYTGFLHAGLVSALIDTSCGFAAAAVAGPVLASHCAVNFLRPAVGTAFRARASVIRAGKRQIFTTAELWADGDIAATLVATGETILMRTEP